MRYAVRYTNVDVLAPSSASSRPWRRWLAPTLFLLALAALCVAVARPHVHTIVTERQGDGDPRARRLGLDAGERRQADAARGRAAGDAHVPRQGAAASRVGLVALRRRGAGRDAADDRPRARARGGRRRRRLPGFGGTAIGDAIATAVRLGRQIGRRRSERRARPSYTSRRRRRRSRARSSRSSSSRTGARHAAPAAARGRGAGAGGRLPGLHRRARDDRHDVLRGFPRRFPGGGGGGFGGGRPGSAPIR